MKKNIIFRLTLMLISSDLDVIWGQDYFEVMNEQQWHNSKLKIFINVSLFINKYIKD